MPATLNTNTNNADILTTIKRAVAYSNGKPSHIALYEYLLGRSLVATSIEEEEVVLHDCRAGGSLLFLLPPYIQVILAALLYTEELNTSQEFSTSDYYKKVDSNILQPTQLLNLSERVIGTNYGTLIHQMANKETIPEDDYLKYFDVEIDRNILLNTDEYLLTRLTYLFNQLSYVNDFTKEYIDIVLTNNRYKAAMYIANKFGYKNESIKTIGDCIEKWIINNSFT